MLLGLQVKLPSRHCSLQIRNFKFTMKGLYQIVHDCLNMWLLQTCQVAWDLLFRPSL